MRKANLYVQYSFVAVAALALAACGSDRDRVARNNTGNADRVDNSADRTAGGTLSSGDRDFVTKAAQGGMAEIEMARLAEQKAQSPRVKEYARHLIDDHTKANSELKTLAANKNISLPADLDSGDRREIDKLRGMSGMKFDQEFMKRAVDDHKDDIKEFEKQADKGDDPALRTFASNTLPSLRSHLEMAENIHGNQKNDADRSSGADRSVPNGQRNNH